MGHCSLCGVHSTSSLLRGQRAFTLGDGLGQKGEREDLGCLSHLVLCCPWSAFRETLLRKGRSCQAGDSRIPTET